MNLTYEMAVGYINMMQQADHGVHSRGNLLFKKDDLGCFLQIYLPGGVWILQSDWLRS